MDIKKTHWIGIALSIVIIISSLFLIETKIFFLMIGIGILAGVSPFVFTMINDTKIASEKEEMFLEFARNLVESVKTGTPISMIGTHDFGFRIADCGFERRDAANSAQVAWSR